MTKKLALAAASVVVSALLCEIYLRTFPPKEFQRLDNLYSLMKPDDLLGYSMRPNTRGMVLSEDGNSEYLVELNEHGLRDAAYAGKRGRRTILGLGDSFLFAESVNREDALMAVLQNLLEAGHPGRFGTMNAGVPGYSTNQEILYYLTRGDRDFDPDIVILFFYINDFALYVKNYSGAKWFDGIPVPDDAEKLPVRWEKDSPFQTWKFIRYWEKKRNQANQVTGRPTRKSPVLGGEPKMFNREWDAFQTLQFHNLEIMLDILKAKIRGNDAKLMLVYLPSSTEIEPGPIRIDNLTRHSYPVSSWDWDLPSHEFEHMAQKLDIPCINLVPVFREHWNATGRSLYFNRAGHFTPEGHRLAAQAVAARVIDVIEGNAKIRPAGTSISETPTETADGFGTDTRIAFQKQDQIVWGAAADVVRRMVNISGDVPYEIQFAPPFATRMKIHFFVHPQSSPLFYNLTAGSRILNQDVRVSSDSAGWKEINIPVDLSGHSPLRLFIVPAQPHTSVFITPPLAVRVESSRPPSVILISLDSLRPDHLSTYGYGRPTAPTLDSFGRHAAVFDDVTSPAPWSIPSHISLLTGVDPFTHKVIDIVHSPAADLPSIPSLLESAGFVTVAFTGSPLLSHHHLPAFQTFFEYDGANPHGDLDRHRQELFQWVDLHRDVPFFLFFHTNATGITPGAPEDDPARYDAGIRRADGMLEELFEHLRRLGLYESSLILVTSGNGEELGERVEEGAMVYGHGKRFYQETTRVPLFLKLPGRPWSDTGVHITEPAGLVDVMPTVLDALHLPLPRILDGQSLLPLINLKKKEPWLTSRLFMIGAPIAEGSKAPTGAIRIENYKLILNTEKWTDILNPESAELYDLNQDPHETVNLLTRHKSWVTDIASDLWLSFGETAKYRFDRSNSQPLK